MKRFLLSLSFLVLSVPLARAEAPCPTEQGTPFKQSQDLATIKDVAARKIELDWWTATDEQISKAHCVRKEPFSAAEMKNWIDEYQNRNKSSVTVMIRGLRLENENPALVEAFKELVIPGKYEEPNASFDAKAVPPGCKKVLCALQASFGEKEGLQTLFMMTKFGFNSSHFAYGNSDPLRAEELDDILISLANLPASLLPIHPHNQLTHFSRGYVLALNGKGSRTIANALISLFDQWTDQSSPMRRYTLSHEIGHHLAQQINADTSAEWLKLSGWQKQVEIVDGKKDENWKSNSSVMVSEYGASNPSEDLAESAAAYRYNPKLLKDISPKKYALIREAIYDGVEYESEESCQNAVPISRTIAAQASQQALKLNPASQIASAQKRCTDKLLSLLTGDSKSTPLENCLQRIFSQSATQQAVASQKFEFPKLASAAAIRNIQPVSAKPQQISQAIELMKRNLAQFIVPALAQKDRKEFYHYRKGETPASMCSAFSKYSYLDLKDTGFNKTFSTDEYMDSNTEAQIDTLVKRICLAVQEKKKSLSPMTQAEISAAAAQIIH